jgi:GNAT superfamily N-acetyltransferase
VISLREARTDADLEAWIGVRRAVPERLLHLAELDGRLAGTGLADRSDVGDRFTVKPRVLPWARRLGVGAALLHALTGHAERFGVEAVASDLEEPEARGFAERFGFREIGREVELALALKRMELAWAAAGAYREVVTWTQQGNHAMRRLNELLGYEYRDVSVTMLAPLPLP